MSDYIRDLERESLQSALSSTERNLSKLRTLYLAAAGFSTWRDWANDVSGQNLDNTRDALYAAYGTLSTKDHIVGRFIEFMEQGGYN